jgi:hypothetical protein
MRPGRNCRRHHQHRPQRETGRGGHLEEDVWPVHPLLAFADAAARSRQAARSAALALVHDEDDEPAAEDDKAPFRRQE